MSDAARATQKILALCGDHLPPFADQITQIIEAHERALEETEYCCWEPGHTSESGERERRVMCVQCADAYAARLTQKQTAALRAALRDAKTVLAESIGLLEEGNNTKAQKILRKGLRALLAAPDRAAEEKP